MKVEVMRKISQGPRNVNDLKGGVGPVPIW